MVPNSTGGRRIWDGQDHVTVFNSHAHLKRGLTWVTIFKNHVPSSNPRPESQIKTWVGILYEEP